MCAVVNLVSHRVEGVQQSRVRSRAVGMAQHRGYARAETVPLHTFLAAMSLKRQLTRIQDLQTSNYLPGFMPPQLKMLQPLCTTNYFVGPSN